MFPRPVGFISDIHLGKSSYKKEKGERGKGGLNPNKLWRWLYKSSFYHIKSVLLDTRFPSSPCGEPWYTMVFNNTVVHVSWEKKRKQLLLSLSAYGSLKSSENVPVDDCDDSELDKTKWTNTSRWPSHPKFSLTMKLHTGLQTVWIMWLSTVPLESGTLISKWNTKVTFIWKGDFGPPIQIFFSLAQITRLWCP